MSSQSLGKYLQQEAKKKGYKNIFIAHNLHIHVTTVSKHFNDNLKIQDSDLKQYCKLLQLPYELLKQSYSQVEHYICEKKLLKKYLQA